MPKYIDIFDKLIQWTTFKRFRHFYEKYKEFLLYLFFGGMTFLISVILFVLFNLFFGMNELIANMLSWAIAVVFAFFTNRVWVFRSVTNTVIEFWDEMVLFLGGRLVTLILEEIILYICISRLHFPNVVVKIIAQIIVIALNYIISKIYVFKKVNI